MFNRNQSINYLKTKNMKWLIYILIFLTVSTTYGQGIKVSGGYFIASSASQVNIIGDGNFENNGNMALADGSEIHFSGAKQAISGTNAISFYNVEANATSYVNVNRDIDIRRNLNLNNGFFDLKEAKVIFTDGVNGQVVGTETNTKRIRATDASGNEGRGNGVISITLNNPSGNVANLGADFTPASNLGTTTITRGHHELQGTGSFTGNYSVYRSYTITPTVQANIDINRFYYFPDELGFQAPNAANLQLFQMFQFGAGPDYWHPQTTTLNVGYVSATITPSNRSSFLVTLGSTNAPLPVELTKFTAQCTNDGILLNWQTASETNASYFSVEKSIDGENFIAFNQQAAQGNSNILVNYQTLDLNPLSETTYYRLVQVDFNGVEHPYPAIVAQCNETYEASILPIYPNTGDLYFDITGTINENYTVQITNSIGQLISNQSILLSAQHQQLVLNNSTMAAGLYHVSLISKNKRISIPFIISER